MMPEPAERIQPEQDYADKLAEAVTDAGPGVWKSITVDGERAYAIDADKLAALIRSTLREQGTEAWTVRNQQTGNIIAVRLNKEDADEDRKDSSYTVHRVLVLEAPA